MKDFTGVLVSHQKAKSGVMELVLKPKFRYFSINLGVWPKDKAPDTEDAKKELMNLGWWSEDDIIGILGDKADNLFKQIVSKYKRQEKTNKGE